MNRTNRVNKYRKDYEIDTRFLDAVIQEISSDRGYIMLQKGTIDIPDKYNELIIKTNKTEIHLEYELLEKEFNVNKFLQTTMT